MKEFKYENMKLKQFGQILIFTFFALYACKINKFRLKYKYEN